MRERWVQATVVLVGLGFVLWSVAAGMVVSAFIGDVRTDTYVVPADARVHLENGRYTIYELVGHRNSRGFGGVSFTRTEYGGPTISTTDVHVAGSDGTTYPVWSYASSHTETITRRHDIFGASLQFRVPSDGFYDIRVDSPPGARFLVSRSFGDTFDAVSGWARLAGLAFFLILAGGIVAAIGGTRSVRRWKAAV